MPPSPELPVGTILTDIKLTVLRDLVLDDPRSPSSNDLGQALLLAIAMLGGFKNRRRAEASDPRIRDDLEGIRGLACTSPMSYQRDSSTSPRGQGPDYIYKPAATR